MQKVKKTTKFNEFVLRVLFKLNRIYLAIFKGKEHKKYKYNISIVAVLKDEAPYIKEWIEYYKLLGVNHFYLYDNKSSDNVYEILKPYIKQKTVTYKYVNSDCHPQVQMYTSAVKKYRYKTKYMLFVDIDEFAVPVEKENRSFLEIVDDIFSKDNKIGGIGINWLCYGSSGHITKPEKLVIESYLYRAKNDYEANIHVKTIANPRKIKIAGIHSPIFYSDFYNTNEEGIAFSGVQEYSPFNYNCKYEHLRINHYSAKSKEEGEKRIAKGFGKLIKDKHNLHDKNDIYDPIMLKYVEILKDKI